MYSDGVLIYPPKINEATRGVTTISNIAAPSKRGRTNPTITFAQSTMAASQDSPIVFPWDGEAIAAPSRKMAAPAKMMAGISKMLWGTTKASKNKKGDRPALAIVAVKKPIINTGKTITIKASTPNDNSPAMVARIIVRKLLNHTMGTLLFSMKRSFSLPLIDPSLIDSVLMNSEGITN